MIKVVFGGGGVLVKWLISYAYVFSFIYLYLLYTYSDLSPEFSNWELLDPLVIKIKLALKNGGQNAILGGGG